MSAITVSFSVCGGWRGAIDKALHSGCPAVDQDYIDVVFDGVAPLCLEVSPQCHDLHSEKSSAGETRASLDSVVRVRVLLNSHCSMLALTGPVLD